MQEKSDAQLLRAYSEHGDEAAFREIVARYTNFVYSVGLRQVNSSDSACELAQGVFCDLARKARQLAEKITVDGSLAGWLHRSTRFAALNHLRDARRRINHEREAMEQLLANSEPNADWEQIRPALDEALDCLADEDREAILLRYFQNRDFRAVGLALGISDDAAQKRVSRAVERLREFFSRRKITVGAGGLTVLISANAVQSAPVGLAAAISTVALTGAAVSTSTAITAVKTIAMATLQKTVIGMALAAAVGAGVFEAHHASQLRHQVQTLQRQQMSLAGRIQELQKENAETTNQLTTALAENTQLQSSPNEDELLRLRNKVTLLKAAENKQADAAIKVAAKSWMDRVNQLKEYLKQHPDKMIPEFKFLPVQRWLNAVEVSGPQAMADTNLDEYFNGPVSFLRSSSEGDFGVRIEVALQKYAAANKGQFPAKLSQLQPYCDPNVEALLQQLYEIKPASILPANRVKAMNIKTGWVVVRKEPAAPRSSSRGAYFAGGGIWWNSSSRNRTQ